MIPSLATWHWALVFLAAGAVLVAAASKLAAAADQIATVTGVGRVFIGMLLLAGATSLPEIATDITAVLADAPDLAVGDLLGSSMANMAILGVLDLLHHRNVSSSVELTHARVSAIAVALTALVALAIAAPPSWQVGWVGVDTIGVALAYIAAVAWLRRAPPLLREGNRDKGGATTPEEAVDEDEVTLRAAVTRFAAAALVVLLAAPVVTVAAKEIAEGTGVAQSTVGAVLLALATSLPELVTGLTAVRMGAHDLAVGNLFGSNAANMAVLVFADVAYLDGPLLRAVSPSQVTAAIAAMLLMSIATAGIVAGAETRIRRLEPDAALLLLAYAACVVAVGATA